MDAPHRLIVLSNPAAGRDEQYNEWYDEHIEDLLEVPGVEAAQRFRLSDAQFPPELMPGSPWRYLAVYEVSGDLAGPIQALIDPRFAEVPEVFDRETERAWWYTACGSLDGPAVESAEHLLMVLSNPASPELDSELNEWYDEHLGEVLSMDAGLVNAQRFRLSDQQFPESVMPASAHRYIALYSGESSPAHTCGTLASAMDGYAHPRALDMESLRDWMFTAIGPRRSK